MTQKMMQARRLIEAFLALMLGQRVPVHWDTRASMDNEGGVHLPLPRTGDAAEIALLTRLAVHEGGHLLETQAGFADRLTGEELGVFNALEDPRMEQRQVQRYPGASLILSRGLDEMLQNIDDALEARLAEAPQRAIQLDLLLRGFLAVAAHGPIARRAPALLERIAPRLGALQRAAIDEALARLPGFTTSLDAEETARALIARLREQEVPEAGKTHGDRAAQDEQSGAESSGQQTGVDGTADPPLTDGEPAPCDGTARGNSGERVSDPADAQDAVDPTADRAANAAAYGPADDARRESSAGGNTDAATDKEAGGGAEPEMLPGASGAGSAGDGDQADSGADASRAEANAKPEREASGNAAGAEPPEADAEHAGASQPQGGSESPETATAAGSRAGTNDAQLDHPGQDPQQATAHTGSPSATGAPGPDTSHADGLTGPGPEPLDLGALLRETLVTRYGTARASDPDAASGPASDSPSDDELCAMELVLAQTDPSAALEELVQASLAALAAGQGTETEQGAPADGAGMSLASAGIAPPSAVDTRLQGVQARLVTVLQRELQERRRRPTRVAYAGGRVMTQRFWRLGALCDTRIFVQQRHAGGIDAAATVLLDSSYSMREQLHTAAEATMAFSLALQRLGVRTRVARFPGVDTVTETLQRFGEPARSCVQRCAGLAASGGTPVGAATATELPLLVVQRRLKNVLVIVTDDQPGDAETLVRALACAQELGVLVVGVGIECDIRACIPKAVSVRDVNELPQALATLFRENISGSLAA